MTTYPSARDVAETYKVGTHPHPYDIVEEYRHTMDVASKHPEKKSGALSSIVELPRGRIRPWVDAGGKPDVVRGLETARDRGWIDVDVDSQTFRVLNTLVAGVFSGGSIDANWVPAFAPDADGVLIARIHSALDELDVGTKTRADDDPDRATEVLPGADGAVLGRVLVALGAPRGEKSEAMDISLPDYLDDTPEVIREDFVQVYLWNRGARPNPSDILQIMESRPSEFFDELGRLIEGVAGAPVYPKEDRLYVSAEAVRALGLTRSETGLNE